MKEGGVVTREETYAEKIAKLLRKAEGGTTPEEADALIAKAQELMTKYAVTQALIDQAQGRSTDEIEQRKLTYVGMHYEARCDLGWAVVRANGCRGVFRRSGQWDCDIEVDGRSWVNWYVITATGFRSDLEHVELLNTSLEVQLASALQSWWRDNPTREWCSRAQGHRERKEFIRGFAHAVSVRLTAARVAGERAAAQDEAVRTSATVESAAESVALVLRSRKDRVDDWYDQRYGSTLRTVKRSYQLGSATASAAGHAYGSRANIGQTGITGQRGLNR